MGTGDHRALSSKAAWIAATRRVLALAAAVALCHLPVWLLGIQAVMPQPLFSVEVLLALALFAWNRPLGVIAMLLAWTLSLLRGVALNYHFHDVPEFLDSFRFAHLLSYSSFVSATSVLLALGVFAGIGTIFVLLGRLRAGATGTVVLLGLLGLADIANGSASAIGLGRDNALVQVNILGTPGYNLLRTELAFLRFGAQPLTPLDPPPRSWAQLSEQARIGRGGAVLILAESLGWPRDDEIRRWLLAQLATNSALGGLGAGRGQRNLLWRDCRRRGARALRSARPLLSAGRQQRRRLPAASVSYAVNKPRPCLV